MTVATDDILYIHLALRERTVLVILFQNLSINEVIWRNGQFR